jgi:2-iminobutanoate/2-iminopropanoate deaminase
VKDCIPLQNQGNYFALSSITNILFLFLKKSSFENQGRSGPMKRFKMGSTVLIILLVGSLAHLAGQIPDKKFLTNDGKRPSGLFAPGLVVGKTVYIAGRGDYKPNEELPNKVRNCLGEIRKTLQVAGLDLKNVVHNFCYLEDPSWYAEFNKVYAEFFPNHPPARTTLGVPNVPGDSRIEITSIAYSDPKGIKYVGAPPAGFPFSPGVIAGDMLYISGKGSQLPEGGHPSSFEEQVRQTMKNVGATLKQAGLDFRHTVMMHVFLDKYENWAVANKVYSEFFDYGDEPARATVFVDWIPGGSHVEVTCWATTQLKNRKLVRPANWKFGAGETAMTASPAVWAGNTLYLSSMVGEDVLSGTVTTDLEQQVRRMAGNHLEVLKTAGLELKDIISGHVYLKDINDYAPMNNIYKEYYSAGPGVRTCLMPNTSLEKGNVRVRASFIAARTRNAETPKGK